MEQQRIDSEAQAGDVLKECCASDGENEQRQHSDQATMRRRRDQESEARGERTDRGIRLHGDAVVLPIHQPLGAQEPTKQRQAAAEDRVRAGDHRYHQRGRRNSRSLSYVSFGTTNTHSRSTPSGRAPKRIVPTDRAAKHNTLPTAEIIPKGPASRTMPTGFGRATQAETAAGRAAVA